MTEFYYASEEKDPSAGQIRAARAAVEWGAKDLGIAVPRIPWFYLHPYKHLWELEGARMKFVFESKRVRGFYEHDTREIWLRQDPDEEGLELTALHELQHLRNNPLNDRLAGGWNEESALFYANEALRRYHAETGRKTKARKLTPRADLPDESEISIRRKAFDYLRRRGLDPNKFNW